MEQKVNQISLDENIFKSVALNITIDEERINKYASILYNKSWVFYHISGEREFITSDNPIMVLNGNTLDVTPLQNGIGQDTTMVCFPISTKLLLVIYSYNRYLGIIKDLDKRRNVIDSYQDSKFIDMQNTLQYK